MWSYQQTSMLQTCNLPRIITLNYHRQGIIVWQCPLNNRKQTMALPHNNKQPPTRWDIQPPPFLATCELFQSQTCIVYIKALSGKSTQSKSILTPYNLTVWHKAFNPSPSNPPNNPNAQFTFCAKEWEGFFSPPQSSVTSATIRKSCARLSTWWRTYSHQIPFMYVE